MIVSVNSVSPTGPRQGSRRRQDHPYRDSQTERVPNANGFIPMECGSGVRYPTGKMLQNYTVLNTLKFLGFILKVLQYNSPWKIF